MGPVLRRLCDWFPVRNVQALHRAYGRAEACSILQSAAVIGREFTEDIRWGERWEENRACPQRLASAGLIYDSSDSRASGHLNANDARGGISFDAFGPPPESSPNRRYRTGKIHPATARRRSLTNIIGKGGTLDVMNIRPLRYGTATGVRMGKCVISARARRMETKFIGCWPVFHWKMQHSSFCSMWTGLKFWLARRPDCCRPQTILYRGLRDSAFAWTFADNGFAQRRLWTRVGREWFGE